MGGAQSREGGISEDSPLPSEDEETSSPPTSDDAPYTNFCLDSATDRTDTTDAVRSPPLNVTMQQVSLIETNLEFSEKISLIFLLNDDAEVGLNYIQKMMDGSVEKFIFKWVLRQNCKNLKWEENLLEALCLIQNYKVLKMMGFEKEDLNQRFLPQHAFATYNLSPMKKALYLVCEDLVKSEVARLLALVHTDFEKKKLEFKIYSDYLEIYFLYWESIDYIKNNNLTNLCKILKQMDKLDLCDNLELVCKKEPTNSTPEKKLPFNEKKMSPEVFNQILNPQADISQFSSLNGSSLDSAMKYKQYQMNGQNPGICLIINQENFYRDPDKQFQHLLPPKNIKLEIRVGTKHDKENLDRTFKLFGYNTITLNNLTHEEIMTKIEEVMKGMSDESSFICCIMSHGDKGVIYGVNSCKINIEQIKNKICHTNRQNLNGKPKILILQCCQGRSCQKLVPTHREEDLETDGPTGSEGVLPLADLFTFYATVPGYGAIRDKTKGSWFIQSLCDKIETFGNEYHFEDICTEVISDVSQRKWNQTEAEVGMVPLKHSTLRFKFYLPPMKKL